MTTPVLIIIKNAPSQSASYREWLDMLFASTSFDIDPVVLFIGDGVLNLFPGELTKAIAALPHYDIEKIYVDQQALLKRKLNPLIMQLPAKPLDNNAINSLYQQHKIILSGRR